MGDTSVKPGIPASCAERPTIGGLVIPVVNARLADGGVDFRSPHNATFERCWKQGLCQVCGGKVARPAVLFGGPNQLRSGRFDEPPLCAPCAVYASRACPMKVVLVSAPGEGRVWRRLTHIEIAELLPAQYEMPAGGG